MAEEALKEGPVWSLGPLVHNPDEVRRLQEMGIRQVERVEEVPAGERLIIRAHGVGPEVLREARQRGLVLIDATCPTVAHAQRAAARYAREGRTVLVVGDADHPEVASLVAWAGGRAVVVNGCDDARSLPETCSYGGVIQTTRDPSELQAVARVLEARGIRIHVTDTSCQVAVLRRKKAQRLAHEVDVLLVVGGRQSANTARLVEAAAETGCQVYHIERAEEIDKHWFTPGCSVGVFAGASTPQWILKEVVEEMEELNQVGERELAGEGEEAKSLPAEYEQTLAPIHPGDLVTGKVVYVGPDGVLVDVGHKTEGLIPPSELRRRGQPEEPLRVGDEVTVYVMGFDPSQEGSLRLSKRRADEELAWQRLYRAQEEDQVIEAEVLQEVKGGLVVDVGLRGFVPASQVERGYVADLSKYVGRTLRLKVLELDRSKNRAVLSQKVVLEEEHRRLQEDTWNSIREGQVRTGIVKGITDFGAFVDLGGVDGLLHISELSWGRVEHPADVLSEGDTVDVMVLRVDRDKGKIALGLKQVLPDPWDRVAEKYPVNSVVEGTVTRLADFGAFVKLEEGVEGLVHISELASRRVSRPDEVVSTGDVIKVKVLKVRPRERRISLSLKEAEQERHKMIMQRYMQRQEPTVTIGEVVGNILKEAKGREEEQKEREEE